ncbi:hypothetical protein [Roseovarius sp.]|uniref:hypothetical protein n=1 Tax=Roseovarius sp. TaxID=1486281 RepID=UPI003D15062A
MVEKQRYKSVWNQKEVPVIIRRTGKDEKHRVRLPFSEDNREWLQHGRRTKPVWQQSGRYWELPKAWFNDFVERALERYRQVYIFQPYREQEKCSPACQKALGHSCQCSCMGANHGAGGGGSWFEVSETFAFRWGSRNLACRLLTTR